MTVPCEDHQVGKELAKLRFDELVLLVMDVVGDSRATKATRVIYSSFVYGIEVMVMSYLAIYTMLNCALDQKSNDAPSQ
jgi:hypothetical protein